MPLFIDFVNEIFLCFFMIINFNRQTIAIDVIYYETLYSHVGYIKFCHISCLLSIPFLIFFIFFQKYKEKMKEILKLLLFFNF